MGKIYFWLEKRDEKLLEIEELSKIDKDWIKKQIDKNIQSTDLIINKDREAYIKYDTAQKVFKLFKLEQKTINRIASTLITNDKTANYRENYHELYTKNNNRVTLIQLKDGTKKIDIRRFVIQDFSLHFLSREFKSFPEELIPVLESLVKLNANILLAGGTGSGKSTLMNCFLKVRDMQKDNGSGILVQKDPEIEIKKIMKNSLCNEIILKEEGMEKIESKLLRSSADYFIFTEMKEKDVIEIFLKIIGRGSEGNMVTYHSSEAEQMIDGIAEQFPEKYKQVQKKLARNLDVVILVQKVKISKNEKRKMITKIVMPYIENNQIEYSTIYEYKVSKNIAKFFELPKNQSTENIKNRNYEENKEIGKIKY
jgi:Flp pilus assembly CpaF family ATPase